MYEDLVDVEESDDARTGFAGQNRCGCECARCRAGSGSWPPRCRWRFATGVSAMTLEAVAKEAGVSKGGLLYHFSSKDELIAAMLEHHAARIQKTVEARMAADPNPQGRWFRALVQTIHGC